ncbi:MAG: glycosyltransferase family 2 protein [Paenibacillaceae bacterium]|nr:glycosyltransferase family 2 protein [Paenibacillaceae bacterium]
MKSIPHKRPGKAAIRRPAGRVRSRGALRSRRKVRFGHVRSGARARSRGSLHPSFARPKVGRTGVLAGAYQAGVRAGQALHGAGDREGEKRLNRSWAQWILPRLGRSVSWGMYAAASARFVRGVRRFRSWPRERLVLLPSGRRTAAIVSADREAPALVGVLDQLGRLPLAEIVVVAGGASNGSFPHARNHPSRPIVVNGDQSFGRDVGRAIGALVVSADILLFLDGDTVVEAEKLVPFVYAIERGADVALNDMTPLLPVFDARDPVWMVREFLNRSLGRGDLGANSLSVIPHAISQKALKAIGAANLIVPPKAQAIAMHEKLRVVAPASVAKSRSGLAREAVDGPALQMAELEVGDCLEALHAMMGLRGERLHFRDALRKRRFAVGRPER